MKEELHPRAVIVPDQNLVETRAEEEGRESRHTLRKLEVVFGGKHLTRRTMRETEKGRDGVGRVGRGEEARAARVGVDTTTGVRPLAAQT